LSDSAGIAVSDWPKERRVVLEAILKDAFEGWYLYHARWKLADAENVLVASEGEVPVGLSILELLDHKAGYVFYIAVRSKARRRGIGSLLLGNSIDFFRSRGCVRVFASVEKDNEPSKKLFESKGFLKVGYAQLSKEYGRIGALTMYSRMVVVPGEMLLAKQL